METSPTSKMRKGRSRLKSTDEEDAAPCLEPVTSVGASVNGEAVSDDATADTSAPPLLDAATESSQLAPAPADDESASSSPQQPDADSEETPNEDAPNVETDESQPQQQGVKRKFEEDESPSIKVEVDDTSDEQATSTDAEVSNLEVTKDADRQLDSSSSEIMTKQLFGKGKRARIPNKRYSDFPLKSTRSNHEPMEVDSPKASGFENGDAAKENIDHDSGGGGASSDNPVTGDASENSGSAFNSPGVATIATKVSTRLSQANSPATPASKKQKTGVDMTNPNFLKPFKYGWKRELVYRASNDNSIKRNSDVYYYAPTGKKVRSMREVSENLKNRELTLEDFTFFKEPLGINDPEKEIIRDAKLKSVPSTPSSAAKRSTPKAAAAKATKSVATPKAALTPKPTAVSSGSAAVIAVPPEVSDEPKPKSSPRLGGFKIKLPATGKAKVEKKAKADTAELETFPSSWTSSTNKKKRKPVTKSVSSPVKKSKRLSAAAAVSASKEKVVPVTKFMDTYFQNVAYGYSTLLHVFQYLKVQDLLRAGCVCSMWHDIANHPMLWKTVRMKNSQIHSFKGLTDSLQKHGTVHLDLRKMLLPGNSSDEIWQEFSKEIKKVESLRKIELCRCPAVVVEQLALSNPKLEVIHAVTIRCESMNIAQMAFYNNLQELRLKSTAGFSLTSNLTALSELTQLKHLSLTSVRDLNKLNIEVIADLKNLESLDLGECAEFPNTFGSEILLKLEKLEKLRLEKGQGNCYTFEILEAVKNMSHLEQLELVNFDIKTGFDRALGACTNIKKLLIIPTYISQSATTNHMVLGGVLRLQSTLSHFVWGVTLELLRVTELFVDQCEDPDKKEKKEKRPTGNGDSIPVLKPVPLLKDGSSVEIPPAQDPPQVEILPLPTLQKLLLQSLPTTRVKILKIPFHATWRQFITDTVN